MTQQLNIVFMGTPEFSANHLKALIDHKSHFHIKAVYTNPDKPQKRSKTPQFSKVKQCALDWNLKVIQVPNFKTPESIEELEKLKPDVIVVVAYGMILPESVLEIPTYGAINIHASLLPQYRGASPIQQALLHGDELTGVTSFLLDSGIDTGSILLQKEVPVTLDDDYNSLSKKLSHAGQECLLETLLKISQSDLRFKGYPQDQHPKLIYSPKIPKSMESLDFNQSALKLHNQIRALNNWPVCSIEIPIQQKKTRLKIFKSQVAEDHPFPDINSKPGALYHDKKRLSILTGDGVLDLLEVQLQGKKRMPVKDFLNGVQLTKEIIAE